MNGYSKIIPFLKSLEIEKKIKTVIIIRKVKCLGNVEMSLFLPGIN